MDGKKESSPKGLIGLGLTIGNILLCVQQAKQDGDVGWGKLDAETSPWKGDGAHSQDK